MTGEGDEEEEAEEEEEKATKEGERLQIILGGIKHPAEGKGKTGESWGWGAEGKRKGKQRDVS